MQHLTAEVPGLLEPVWVRREIGEHRARIDRLESLSLMATTIEKARALRQEGSALYERLMRLARAGYTPLACMPHGSFVSPEFDALGAQVNELMRRVRRVVEHCQQIENMVQARDQAEAEREHRRRFPQELAFLEAHREVLAALYPDRWLLLYDGAIRAEYGDVQEALRAGEDARGRDEFGRPLFLIYCHRTQKV